MTGAAAARATFTPASLSQPTLYRVSSAPSSTAGSSACRQRGTAAARSGQSSSPPKPTITEAIVPAVCRSSRVA